MNECTNPNCNNPCKKTYCSHKCMRTQFKNWTIKTAPTKLNPGHRKQN